MKYENEKLIIAGSEDFSYFHNVEIEFHDVAAIASNFSFRVDPTKDFFMLADLLEARTFNNNFGVTEGYTVFKFVTEDMQKFFIAAKGISFRKEVVKYYSPSE